MSRIAALVSILALAGAVGWLGLEASRLAAERRNARRARSVLPSVELVDPDDRPATVEPALDRTTILVFLTSTCEFCRYQMGELRQNASAFTDFDVVFISPERRQPVRALRREYELEHVPQFRVVRDTVPTLARLLHVRRVPTILVYDTAGRLNGEFEGLTPSDRILDAAEATR